MTEFRQKEFIAPLVLAGNVAMGALTAGQMVQAHKQGKEQEAQSEAMQEKLDEQNRALERIARRAEKNPELATKAGEVIQERGFSARRKLFGATMNNAVGFAKDLGKAVWKRKEAITSGTLMAGAGAVTGYAANKYIQKDMEKQQQQQQRAYAMVSGKAVLGSAKEFIKNHKGGLMMGGAMGAMPLLTYQAQKAQQSGQIEQTAQPQQRAYAGVGGFVNNMRQGLWRMKAGQGGLGRFYKKPLETTLSGVSSLAGGGGKKAVNKFANELAGSSNPWSQKTGQFLKNNPKTALAGSAVVGGTVLSTSWDLGEKGVKKGFKAIDKNAYAYEDSQNQQIQ